MEQNQQNEKFHVVVTNAATGEAVADWTESAVVVIASNIDEAAAGTNASSRSFINGAPLWIAQLMADDEDLLGCARLALLIRAADLQKKEDAE